MQVGEQHEVVAQERELLGLRLLHLADELGRPTRPRRSGRSRPRPPGTRRRRWPTTTPAPARRARRRRAAHSSRTPSGVIATRCSLFLTSPGTPTVRLISASFPRRLGAPLGSMRACSIGRPRHRRSLQRRLLSGAVPAPRIAVASRRSAPPWLAEAVRAGRRHGRAAGRGRGARVGPPERPRGPGAGGPRPRRPALGAAAVGRDRAVPRTSSTSSRLWTCGKGVYAEPVAELALTLLLAGLRGGVRYARADHWTGQFGTSLFDGRVTIVGGGGIAEVLARLLAPFRGAGHGRPAPPRADGPRRRGRRGRGPARGAARRRRRGARPRPGARHGRV